MNKKLNILLIIFITFSIFTGCAIKSTDLPVTRTKPNKYYYTNILANSLINDNSITGAAFEINLHKEKELPKEGYENLLGFFKGLKSKNFIDRPADLPEKPEYKLFITTNNEKYVINIFNEKYVTIHPWDGVYIVDYIDMSDISTRFNLHALCRYFFK